MDEVYYDVIVVGGGPIGLAAAYYCAKQKKRVLVLEQFTFGNAHGSSAGYSRQFRICYAERHLTELAIEASKEWDTLMFDLNDFMLMERTGTLWFGDPSPDGSNPSGEGSIDAAIHNLESFMPKPEYEVFNGYEELKKKFPFIAEAVAGVQEAKGLFVKDGGTVNVPGLIKGLHKAVKQCNGCRLMQSARASCIDYSDTKKVTVKTIDGQVFHGMKVILAPGAYINSVLSTLEPSFDKLINLDIYLWSSAYFKIAESGHPSPTTWPTWYYFGKREGQSKPTNENLFYGFPIEHPTPKHIRVSPAFVSEDTEGVFYSHLHPKDINDRFLDRSAIKFTSEFVQRNMKALDPVPVEEMQSTCVVGFASRVNGDPDNSGGIVVDFIPDTQKRIALAAGGWCMKYIPVMGLILAQMALDGAASERFAGPIKLMGIDRGILVNEEEASSVCPTHSQKAAQIRRLFCY